MAILAPNATWGDPIASWVYASPVASVEFTDLGDYREILIVGEGLTSDTGGTSGLNMRVSTDNGATFVATGYLSVGTTSTTALVLTSAVATATPQAVMAEVINFNAASYKTRLQTSAGTEGSASAAATRIGQAPAAINNAVQLFWSGSANANGGTVRIYGKRG